MSDTLHPSLAALDDCGCGGRGGSTPGLLANPEGQTSLHYRIGTYAAFRQSMLAALTEAGYAPLHALATRDPDDFTIALLDAWAVVADILTFYQERLAQESYLRTAIDAGSIRRLARLIGYQPAPGVAASSWLAFTLDPAPGAPASARLPVGLKVQSVPGQDETPQLFETVEALDARVEWNAIRPALAERFALVRGQTELFLRGTATQLQKGDALLLVGDERELHPNDPAHDERWDLRILTSVETDLANDRTRVTWDAADGLGRKNSDPPADNPRVYALRQRGSLFGHNAPDPNLMTVEAVRAAHLFNTVAGVRTWKDYCIADDRIDLDAAYSKVVPGGWIALQRVPGLPGERGYAELYRASDVSFPSVTDFGLSGKITRIRPDTTEHLAGDFFPLDETIAYFASEELAPADPPLRKRATEALSRPIELAPGALAPLEGTRVTLEALGEALPPGRVLIVSGRRCRARVARGRHGLVLADDAGTRTAALMPGESLIVLAPPTIAGASVTWRLRHDAGFEGTLTAALADLLLAPAAADDPLVSEQVTVDRFTPGDPPEIVLSGGGLQRLYDRSTTTLAANVALGTHGETVEEIAGNGDAAAQFQSFPLKQAPLTYLPGSGTATLRSTLEVRIDNLLWREVGAFFERGRNERVYVVRPGDGQSATVHFGDGQEGARLPSGERNVRLRYRKGGGLAGMVRAGQLTQLLSRPLGLRAVTNPLPAEGADEPEALEDARQNAPLTVLTLDRAVSLQDYEDYARAFPGIGKALATWTWDGRRRGVLITVAGPGGALILPGGSVDTGLTQALRASGDPFVPLRVAGYAPVTFDLAGGVVVHPDHAAETVLAAVRAALRAAFGFAARSFGQPVFLSEVLAVMQAVAGVVAIDLDHLQRSDAPVASGPAERLDARRPLGGSSATSAPAELLLLADGPLETIIQKTT